MAEVITPNGEELQEVTPEEEERLELERKIALLEQARINLRVTPTLFNRLNNQAEFMGLSIEDHCAKILEDSLNQLIGKPVISAPSKFSNQPTLEKKISGPSYSVSRG
jgi:predicted HicB family RNase H-like nuclease